MSETETVRISKRTGKPVDSRRGFHSKTEEDTERHKEIGRKGGNRTASVPGRMQAAGRAGGNAILEKYGPDYMAEIGRRGGEAKSRQLDPKE